MGILSIYSKKTRPLPQNFYQIKLCRGLSREKDKKQSQVVTSVNEQTKKELEETKRRYEDLFELAPDAIVILDETGVITSCNAATTILSGYS